MSLLALAKEAAIEAGHLLREGFDTSFTVRSKDGKKDLVTEYDFACENLIVDKIKKVFPSHNIIAEESHEKEEPSSEEITWIIDPLDGTVNFAHSIPLFAVSIAIAKGKDILAGVIYIPMLDELFWAEKGQGAFLGTQRIEVSLTKTLDQAILATGFPYNVDENPLRCIDRFGEMLKQNVPLRRIGSAAMDLAYVACGRFDAFWEVSLHSWDMAAGKLLIEEARGTTSTYDGSEHPIYGYHPLIASNQALHQEMVDLLKEDL